MNTELPKPVELSLPQALLLLATNDRDGKPEVPVFALRTAVAGAILAELDMLGAIELQGKHVRATGTTPQTDLEHELEVIRGKSRPHTPQRWVSILEGHAPVQRIYEGMVSRGIVERTGDKHLGLFRSVRYPEKDHAPEAALLDRIRAVFTAPPETGVADEPAAEATGAGTPAATPGSSKPKGPDTRTLALIALLQAAGLLPKLFPDADRVWADELAKDYWPARAVEDELRLTRLGEEEAATL
ncbi:GPP34 family phosphoprotein [Pseudarthrobacter sp. NamE2]|uniref:GOLPH3/VPS74 family protein n=1 Tax=Pseudarthrobacter sp. NamE2 TaxID=2576838 RepID=UPI0010FE1E7F|nr:GPP34 family phosphoprotein [Pseudarthrobacter sp. NamE2]TLM82678.1 GPP34 family phosphoprotein [Pseudarthrobacter sp. NamE2]